MFIPALRGRDRRIAAASGVSLVRIAKSHRQKKGWKEGRREIGRQDGRFECFNSSSFLAL